MTKINKLVMHGFKSFAKRTELIFGDKYNCILGPNGSGKSNILDALCFVLGKTSAKALRSEKSANLIYNGGKSKTPAKSAEVSIYFDNQDKIFPTEDYEVKVSRIVKPTGQSIYKINDEKRTRQQIIELLSLARINPNGYNVILQGDIINFVEMQPEERRRLVEEIAGISIYEEKKNKALNELNKVEERLKESEIILNERHNHLKDLKKEKEQAMKFKDLNDKIKINKASLIHKQITRKTKEKSEFDEKIDNNSKNLEEKQKLLDDLKQKIRDNKKEIDNINKEIESKGEKEQVDIHKEVEKLKVDIASSKNRVDSVKNEITKIKARKDQLKQNIQDIEEKIKKVSDEKDELLKQIGTRKKEESLLNDRIAAFKKKNNLDEATKFETDIDELDKQLEGKEKEMQELRQKQQEALRNKDRIEFQIQAIDEKIEKVLEVEKENKAQIEELKQKKQEFKKATLELTQALNDDSSMSSQLANARRALVRANEELAKLNVRNISMQEALNVDTALNRILKQKDTIRGIYGTVAELGDVSAKYSTALEIAAGNKIKNVVVKDDTTAARCIKYLKENKFGVVSFMPLNKIKPRQNDPNVSKLKSTNGVQGTAIDLIDFDPKFKNVFSNIFGNTLIIDTIDVARRIGVGKAKMVTLDGDLTEVSGVMQGGYRRKKSKGLGFNEKEVSQKMKVYEKEAADNQALISRLEKDKAQLEEKIIRLREFKANLEGEIIKLEKSLNIDASDLEASRKARKDFEKELVDVDKRSEEINNKISEFTRSLTDTKIKRQQLRSKISELRNPAMIAELNAFEEKKRELREQIFKRESDISGLESQIENVLSPEVENINKVIKQHDKEEDDFKKEMNLIQEQLKGWDIELKEKETKQKKFHEQFKGLFNQRTKLDDEIKKHEEKVENISEQHRKIELRINTYNLERTKIGAELSALENEFKEYEGVKIDESKQEQTLRKEIGIWEGVLTRIGNVNMKSLEIYDSIEKEYNELLNKKERLLLEKEDVLVMMNEIEVKKTELFRKTFNVVNDHFQSTFSSLTTKGAEASLVLENPESPFDGGLFIKVKLTGKRFMDIRSLSGGEKTLTALAFIFSIQEFEPASFYVLDEVDAALDKRNSERLASLIRQYTDKAQYIVITHNDGVISEADILYGISMNEHGMSQVTSLRI